MEGKRWEGPEIVWEELRGKRLVLAGADGTERCLAAQTLAAVSAGRGNTFQVAEGIGQVREGDYVLLFARPEGNFSREKNPSEPLREVDRQGRAAITGTADAGSGQEAESGDGAGSAGRPRRGRPRGNTWAATAAKYSSTREDWEPAREFWDGTLELLLGMEALAERRPAAALLLSGWEVYGKCFGVSHPLREEELGYLSHTDRRDAAAQGMRTAEHFACRFASEGALPIRIARIGAFPAGEAAEALLGEILRVLLYGKDGETYNLSGAEAGAGGPSPLSPSPIRVNTEKAGWLRCD